jgi:hypothetical protein
MTSTSPIMDALFNNLRSPKLSGSPSSLKKKVGLVCTLHALRTLPAGLTYKIKLSLCKKSLSRENIRYSVCFGKRHYFLFY